MDEDVSGAAGLKSSSSAPDLHLLLDGALQGGPRSLLSPRQHFSGSTVGALVPYKGTEARIFVPASVARVRAFFIFQAAGQHACASREARLLTPCSKAKPPSGRRRALTAALDCAAGGHAVLINRIDTPTGAC